MDPCIPATWKAFSVTRRFRNRTLHIKVVNPVAVQKGVKQLTLNGQTLQGSLIPARKLKRENQVLVEMG